MEKKILVIDDDKTLLNLIKIRLSKLGYNVLTLDDSSLVIQKINSFGPDVLIVDLMMPDVDGFAVIKKVKESSKYSTLKIIVMSAKTFDFDKKRAYELGADAYLIKPVQPEILADSLEKVISDEIKVTFWGTRGTVPTPGKTTLKYGGNTPCVSVELSKDSIFVFDAGTGIINFGKHLVSHKNTHKINIFISHPHWDHIHGFPFFLPAYMKGNEIAIHGSSHGDISVREVISGQMESIYFPITLKEFAARIYFNELSEGQYNIEGISINTIMLNHPGNTLGYKLKDTRGKTLAYITDNELVTDKTDNRHGHFRKKLVKFLDKVDVLIHDTTYFDDEYKTRVGWGHPPLTEVLKLAIDAKVKSLYLFHHDPDHSDDKILEKENFAKLYLKNNSDIKCSSAVEGSTIKIRSLIK